MTLQTSTDPQNGNWDWRLTISAKELQTVVLQVGDRLLFKECDKSERISDKLLALETLV